MLRLSETHRVCSPAMKRTVLRRHPVFGGLPLEHLERLSTYASTGPIPAVPRSSPRTALAPACSRYAPGPFGLRFRHPMVVTQSSA
jgi:hypothetical protein